jgi:hypothetical protein
MGKSSKSTAGGGHGKTLYQEQLHVRSW